MLTKPCRTCISAAPAMMMEMDAEIEPIMLTMKLMLYSLSTCPQLKSDATINSAAPRPRADLPAILRCTFMAKFCRRSARLIPRRTPLKPPNRPTALPTTGAAVRTLLPLSRPRTAACS